MERRQTSATQQRRQLNDGPAKLLSCSFKTIWIGTFIGCSIFLLCMGIVIFILSYLKRKCSKSLVILFFLYLGLLFMLGCCKLLDRPSAPWYHDTRKKYCFVLALYLVSLQLNTSVALDLGRVFGPLGLLLLFGATVAILVLGYCLIFIWFKQPVCSPPISKQCEIQDHVVR